MVRHAMSGQPVAVARVMCSMELDDMAHDSISICPEYVENRVIGILYPGRGEEGLSRQYAELKQLIDEVLMLAEA